MSKKIGSYLRAKCSVMVLCVSVAGIFWLVLYLYNIRGDALDYAVLLSASLLAAGGLGGFVRYCRHISLTKEALNAVPEDLKVFPAARDIPEKIYQEKMQQLFDYNTALETEVRISRQEMLDYYSLWVHQIKTPISAMRLLLQSYEEGEIEEEQEDFIHPMKMELFKTEQYVEMVLSYLRLDEMSSDLSLQWYNIDEIVRQAVKKYSQLFILKKISLNYKQSGIMVLTDEKWLLLVLEQILSNALKYTVRGTISIYMEPGEGATLVIEDTGIGIQAEDLPRIFEKGFTGYNGRRDKKSTGIGLYLCKSICTKLNHGLKAESEVGKGTKVKLELFRKERVYE